ncbi:MAG: T9SS type A sorting domain-containing protein, partial [Bacteroidota bacterium]
LSGQEYEVYTTFGKILLTGRVSESATVSLSELPLGTYFIRLPQTQQFAVVVKE